MIGRRLLAKDSYTCLLYTSENPGYSVFDEAGKVVYTGAAASATYTVQKGDSLWAIAAEYLGNRCV